MDNLFQILNEIPSVCTYVFVDKATNSAFLQWSNGNALNQIANNITLLSRGVHNNKKLQKAYNRRNVELKILKAYDEPIDNTLLRMHSILLFQKTPYLDMTGKYHLIEYTIETRIFGHYAKKRQVNPLLYILMKSPSQEAIVLAIFDNANDAEFFLKINYTKFPDKVVFSRNELTQGYHKQYGYKLIDTR